MTAKFEAESLFSIRGRGLVVVGRIIEGRIKVGSTFSIPPISNKLTVISIEWPYVVDENGERRRGLWGFLFSFRSEQENSAWKNIDVKGQIIEFNDPE
jgi:hypothetical protein